MQTLGWVLAIFLGAGCGLMYWYGDNEVAVHHTLIQQQIAQQQQVLAQRQHDVDNQEKNLATAKDNTAELASRQAAAQKENDGLTAKIDDLKKTTSNAKGKASRIVDLCNDIMDLKGKLNEALGK